MPPAASLATSLKRGEGEPLTRHDIQYALLEKIFDDKHAVFTPRPGSIYDKPGTRITFGELYIEDVLCSNKLSKTLKDKFLNDMDVTRKVCMATVLVNTGRINTTLVFTPTQARTYNPIPAIQAYGSGHKMLQDAPRLKGILKGSCDNGPPDWVTMRQAQKDSAKKPIVSPVNLIFLLTHTSTTMDIQHFPDPHFLPHELLSDYHFTSDSRARAFLWLMYFYIETNGTAAEQESNPFGAGPGNCRVPTLVPARETDSLAENIDLPREVEYANKMAQERQRYLASVAQQKGLELAPRSRTNLGPSCIAAYADIVRAPESNTPAEEALAEKTLAVETPAGKIPAMTTPAAVTAATPEITVTPSQVELDSVRRSSRKVKRKTYESADGDDLVDVVAERDDYRSQRASQILRHKLRRSQHATKKQRRRETAIQRAFKMEVDDERIVFDDEDGEEALTLASCIRRAQRRIERRYKRVPASGGHGDRHPESAKKLGSSGGSFKIKLKF